MFEGSDTLLMRAGVDRHSRKPLLSVHSTYMCTAVGIVIAIGFVIAVGFVVMQKRVSSSLGV